ncbi:MAG TPA: hypothetical protein VEY91_09850 [Candidatus Limnocylindria bacterium]|nr:hypothetical protein [Candidatus Limnocylindria bacterium]
MRRDQPERRNRLRLPLQLQRLHRLHSNRAARQRKRRGAYQHFAGRGGLFQAGGNVDRVAGGESLGGAGDDLAGGEADPTVHPQVEKGVAHLDRRAASADAIVFVQHRHAENRHYRIADELLHGAAV